MLVDRIIMYQYAQNRLGSGMVPANPFLLGSYKPRPWHALCLDVLYNLLTSELPYRWWMTSVMGWKYGGKEKSFFLCTGFGHRRDAVTSVQYDTEKLIQQKETERVAILMGHANDPRKTNSRIAATVAPTTLDHHALSIHHVHHEPRECPP